MSKVSGVQIRTARALLGITAQDLADLSGLGWATVQRIEAAEGIPEVRVSTLKKITSSLEAEGIKFIGDPVKSPGVQLKHKRS